MSISEGKNGHENVLPRVMFYTYVNCSEDRPKQTQEESGKGR